MLITALNWLRLNWKLVAVIVFIFSWSAVCYNAGRRAVIAEWEAEKAEQILAIQAEKDRLQDEANQKSKELEKSLADMRVRNQQLNKELAHEIRINQAAYANCVLAPASVQLWNTSAKGGSAE